METSQFGFQGGISGKVKKKNLFHGQEADGQPIPADVNLEQQLSGACQANKHSVSAACLE